MSSIRWIKRNCIWFISLFLTLPTRGSLAKDSKETMPPTTKTKQEQPGKVQFSKEELNKALKEMSRDPKSIKTVCAMCYKVAMSTNDIEYHCNACGHAKIYPRNSDQGALANMLPIIKRSLGAMPYKISIDDSGLCPVCGKDKSPVLVAHVHCFDCGKEFSWEIRNQHDIDMLKWLYIKPPVKELDARNLNLGSNGGGIKEGAIYIRDHVYCPVCRKKIKLVK